MDSEIKTQELNAAFPGNTLGVFDEPDAVIPDAFVPGPGPARAWVQAALTQHEANLPRPPVPASAAPQLLEFAHYANLGAQVEREALAAIELTVDNVLDHVCETLRFDPASLRCTEMGLRVGTFVAGHAAAFLASQARRAPGSQVSEPQHAACLTSQARCAPSSQAPQLQFVREALTDVLLAATHRGDFSAADDVDNAAALAEFLVPHLTLEQRQGLAPWLLRAGGAASDAVLRDVRDSFAQLQASSPAYLDASTHPHLDARSLASLRKTFGEWHPLVTAAARKVQTWYFRAAAKAWAPGLPSSERLRLQAQTAPLQDAAADAAGAWPEPLDKAAAPAPPMPDPHASAARGFLRTCRAAVGAAEEAGTALDAATAQRLERACMALTPDERAGVLLSTFWLGPLCLARPGSLARLIAGQPPAVRARALDTAADYALELIAEWAPLMLAGKVQVGNYTPWEFTTPPKSAAERRENLKRLSIGLDALKALAVHFSHVSPSIDALSVALYAGLEGLRAAAPVFGFDVRQVAQKEQVIQALFMSAAPEACAQLLAFVRPQPKVEALAWQPINNLMKHVGPEQLLALMQALPPTTETEAHLYLNAALAGRLDLLNLIRKHSQQPDALMTTPIVVGRGPSVQAHSLLDCFAVLHTWRPLPFPKSRAWSPEVFEHLTRAALALPPNFSVPAAAAFGAIDGDNPELLGALNARTPLTPDDWWQALHVSAQAKPRMLRAVSEHLAGAGPTHEASEAADLQGVFNAWHSRGGELILAARGEKFHAMADWVPGTHLAWHNVTGESEARALVRFKALTHLTLKLLAPMDLRTSVAKLPAVEQLSLHNLARVEGWGALAGLPQLTSLEIVGELSDEALDELLAAGLAPKLDLHCTYLTARGRVRALAAMWDCVPPERWPEPLI